jgi:hypothetical protein
MFKKLVILTFAAFIILGIKIAYSQEIKIEAPDGSVVIIGNPSSETTQGTWYDKEGYNREGYDSQGYDRQGYDRTGYDRQGYDRNGLDRKGYDRSGQYISYKTYNEKESYDKEHHDNGKHKGWYKQKNKGNKHNSGTRDYDENDD